MVEVKEIWFDMDGTIANFYGVENWLDYLDAEDSTPYRQARPLVNMSSLARLLNKLQREGYKLGIVSWLSKCGSESFNAEVTTVKIEWLETHLKSVHFDSIDILTYGTTKQIGRNGILFDDEKPNRDSWNGTAFDVDNIIEILKSL